MKNLLLIGLIILGSISGSVFACSCGGPNFNQEDIAVMGFSQGGGLAMMVAGVDDRVDVLASSIPSHCQHGGIEENKASGFPYYLQRYTGAQRQVVKEATSYYENSFFVKRIKFK